MLRRLRNKKGFTMIELMIVAIIVAILAVVLIPLMTGNKLRAYATEAEAALGTVRTALRAFYAENNRFPTTAEIPAGSLVEGNVPGIVADDLDGTYLSGACYTITTDATGSSYDVTCDWSLTTVASGAPQAATILALPGIAAGVYVSSIDEDGVITRTGY